MSDPTVQEMRDVLSRSLYASEADVFDVEGAIYWFCTDWHGGAASNLYSALSSSEYHPGARECGPEPGSIMQDMYEELEITFTTV